MLILDKNLNLNYCSRKNKLLEASHRYKYALRRIPRLDVSYNNCNNDNNNDKDKNDNNDNNDKNNNHSNNDDDNM